MEVSPGDYVKETLEPIGNEEVIPIVYKVENFQGEDQLVVSVPYGEKTRAYSTVTFDVDQRKGDTVLLPSELSKGHRKSKLEKINTPEES